MEAGTIAVVVIVVVVLFYFFANAPSGPTSQTTLHSAIVDAKKETNTNIVPTLSSNQPEGITFSYSCWLNIRDFTYNYGKVKTVFTRGPSDLSSVCPGLFIDGTTNTLLVKVDTFGKQEIVSIPNIPAKKWLHFVLAVDQDSMDVYINGTLHTHHTITQLPRQNPGAVRIGSSGSGFDGSVASLQYYNYFLHPADIRGIMSSPPSKEDPDVPSSSNMPPYFATSWWLKSK